jgi:hypothetical protein
LYKLGNEVKFLEPELIEAWHFKKKLI